MRGKMLRVGLGRRDFSRQTSRKSGCLGKNKVVQYIGGRAKPGTQFRMNAMQIESVQAVKIYRLVSPRHQMRFPLIKVRFLAVGVDAFDDDDPGPHVRSAPAFQDTCLHSLDIDLEPMNLLTLGHPDDFFDRLADHRSELPSLIALS